MEKMIYHDRAAYLIGGFLRKDLTGEEEQELDRWILESDHHMELFEYCTDDSNVKEFLIWFETRDVDAQLARVKKRIKFKPRSSVRSFVQYAAAACLLGLMIFGGYRLLRHVPTKTESATSTPAQDIEPGTEMATLRLADNQVITLDRSRDTVINKGLRIEKGQVIYTAQEEGIPQYNEIVIPRKGFYRLVLPDGSKVWLNSASSIRYPISFQNADRKVSITGEAYFEVVHDPTHPFAVQVNGLTVQDLGTRFNINAYGNEPSFTATLLEGAIKLSDGTTNKTLRPNDQVLVREGNWTVQHDVETSSITAWKDNQFKLKDASIDEIMRQVERWYDAKIVYADKVNSHFNGTISRSVPVSQLLKLLEETGNVHFSIEGDQITVKK